MERNPAHQQHHRLPGYSTNTLQQLRELIRQRYNHPSVVCWGLFNEITLKLGPDPIPWSANWPNSPPRKTPPAHSTAAANASDNEPSTWYSELISFNKYLRVV